VFAWVGAPDRTQAGLIRWLHRRATCHADLYVLAGSERAQMDGTPWELVLIRGDLDQEGGLPEDAHHVAQRSLRPDLKQTASNLHGTSHQLHMAVHEHGKPLDPHARDLNSLW
jgi:hypothetical protein